MKNDNSEGLERRIAELEAKLQALKTGFFEPSQEETVKVPEPMRTIFNQAQAMVRDFFRGARSDPSEGTIEIDGDRYILVRASALSTNFIDAIVRVYADRSREEAEAIGRSLLFDLAHTIGLNDARNIHRKMGLTDPIEKLSAGPVHFAYAGWAFVDIRSESNPVPNDDFVIMYDHPYSFEAHTWLAAGRKSEYPVCVMNAGYSSGWCEESFGIPLTAVEVTCRAKGDDKCTFLMAPPHRIVERVREYFGINIKDQIRKGLSIPAYFERKVVEDKLRDSERMFRAVVDQTYQFIGLLKTDGTLIDVNETALAFSGIVKSDVMNKPFWEGPWWTHSPQLQDKVRDAVKRTAAGEFVRFEATHPAKDGSMHYVDFSMKPVRDEEGKIIMLLPEGRDITERKMAEDSLRKSERMFRAVVDQTYQFIGLLKTDGTLIDVNETALAFSGIVKSDVMNKPFWEGPWWTHSAELQEKVRDAVKRTAQGEFVRFEATHPAKDGSLHYIDFSMKPVHDNDGMIIMLLPEGRDITERKMAEEELRRERDFRRTIIEASPAFFVAIRGDGTTLSMNESMLKALGYTAEEVVGKDYLTTFVPPADRATLAGVFTQLISSPLPSLNVNRVLAASGQELIVEWRGRSIFKESGEVDYFFGIGTDITERKKVEEALRESEERFSQIVNRAVVGVFRTALDGMALLANPSVMRMFDFDSVEAFNAAGGVTNFYQNLEDRQRLFAALMQGPVTAMEIPFYRRDRSVMILSLSAKLVRDDKGNPQYIEGTLEDISERKKVEQALRESEERFSQIVNRAVVGVFRTDLDGKALLANPAVLKVFGYDTVEAFNADGGVTHLYQNLDDRLRLITALMKGPVYGIEIPFYRRDRSGMILSLSVNLVRDEKGNPLYIEGTMEDITARKKAEQALRESEERFTQVVNRAIVGVFRTDLNGMALLANPAVLKIFGYETIEAFNADGGVTHLYQNAEDRQRLIAGLMKGTVSGMEMPFYRRDGSEMFLSVSANLMRDEKGNPQFIEGTLEDVTRRLEAERQLQRTMIELKRSNRELEEFASVASHDLQEPLRKILTFSDRIKSRVGTALDQESQDYFDRMQNAASRMQNLINDLLSYSRVTTQAKPFVSVNLDELAHDVLVDLELRIRPGLDRVDIADLPTIEADPGQIRQLLYNLISNALKFRRADQPALVKVEGGIDKDRCLIRVRDNGIGFDEKYRESIFGIFKRLHSRSEYEGTGVGLAICKKIVERHGGSITAYSTPGQGATFEAVLPQRH